MSNDDSFQLFKEIIHLYQNHRDELPETKSEDMFVSEEMLESTMDQKDEVPTQDKLPDVSTQPNVFKFVPPSSAPKSEPSKYRTIGVQTSRDGKVEMRSILKRRF